MSTPTSPVQPREPLEMRLGRRVGVLLASVLVVGVGLSACSLPVDDDVTTYSPDELPIDLSSPSTTTTTTTTTTTSVPVTGDSQPVIIATTAPAPSTTPPVDLEPVKVFYRVSLTGDAVRSATVRLVPPVQLDQLVQELATPDPSIRASGLRTSVPVGLIESVVIDRGVANVDLSRDVLDNMTLQEQQPAIAQLVLTLTSFITPDAGAIGRVTFSVAGDPIPAILPDGTSTDPGEQVAYQDYIVLIEGQNTTTTTTTVPQTTIPLEPVPESTEPVATTTP